MQVAIGLFEKKLAYIEVNKITKVQITSLGERKHRAPACSHNPKTVYK